MSAHPWLEYKNWAVVGASQDSNRYGYKIHRKLEKKGYNAIPVTPKYKDIEGTVTYPSLLDIDQKIDVVNFVVNPQIGMKVLDECIQLGIKRIWLQPGTQSERLIQRAEDNGIEVVDACILVVLSWV